MDTEKTDRPIKIIVAPSPKLFCDLLNTWLLNGYQPAQCFSFQAMEPDPKDPEKMLHVTKLCGVLISVDLIEKTPIETVEKTVDAQLPLLKSETPTTQII